MKRAFLGVITLFCSICIISCQKEIVNPVVVSNTNISGEWRFALFVSHNSDLTTSFKDNTIVFLPGNVAEFHLNKGVIIEKGSWVISTNPPCYNEEGEEEEQTYYFKVEYIDSYSGGLFQIILEDSIIRNSLVIGSNIEGNVLCKLEKL